MKYGLASYLILLFAFFSACRTQTVQGIAEPQAVILKKVFLPNLPSASGVELVDDSLLYILSDDSPYLYVLNRQYRLIDSIELFKTEHFINGRIPPKLKYDPECLALFEEQGERHLLALGSGSTADRERVFWVNLPKTVQKRPAVQERNMGSFYSMLKADTVLSRRGMLNLEGLATDREYVYLLPRSLTPPGHVLLFDRDSFRSYALQTLPQLPAYKMAQVWLPVLHQVPAGFSGAAVADGYLFFSASVENTTSATLDGDVLGSFIGRVPLRQLQSSTAEQLIRPENALIKDAGGKVYDGKVESLAVLEKKGKNQYRAIAVVDNDKGQSEVLELELRF